MERQILNFPFSYTEAAYQNHSRTLALVGFICFIFYFLIFFRSENWTNYNNSNQIGTKRERVWEWVQKFKKKRTTKSPQMFQSLTSYRKWLMNLLSHISHNSHDRYHLLKIEKFKRSDIFAKVLDPDGFIRTPKLVQQQLDDFFTFYKSKGSSLSVEVSNTFSFLYFFFLKIFLSDCL